MYRELQGPTRPEISRRLSPKHYQELRESGLNDDTIDRNGFYTEYDPSTVSAGLNWSSTATLSTMGPFLAIPYFDPDGKLVLTRYKPDIPRRIEKSDGKHQVVKYESPKNVSTIPYFTREVVDWLAASPSSSPIFITEGEKKALKASQEGFPCIGLPGITNWSALRKKGSDGRPIGKRQLCQQFQNIDWTERTVVIVPDGDEFRNPDVNRETAELARLLEEAGAVVHIVWLPTFWNKDVKRHEKQGLDDYLVRRGRKAFERLIQYYTRIPPTIPLEEFRVRMKQKRDELIVGPGLYLDNSPPGSGKSYDDFHRSSDGGKVLIAVPTHRQAEDVVEKGLAMGLDVAKFPERTKENCHAIENVRRHENIGLNASEVLCPGCQNHGGKMAFYSPPTCPYHREVERVKQATILVATHERLRRAGRKIFQGRRLVSIHEDVLNILAPTITAKDGFAEIRMLAEYGLLRGGNDAVDENLKTIATFFETQIANATETCLLKLPQLEPTKGNVSQRFSWLYDDSRGQECFERLGSRTILPKELQNPFNPQAVRLCLLALTGRLRRAYVRITPGNERIPAQKAIVGIIKAEFPKRSRTLMNDATANLRSLPREFRERIVDITPHQKITQMQNIIQYPVDVTKSTKQGKLVSYVRALLRRHPDKKRVGVITHRQFVLSEDEAPVLRNLLTPSERERIAKIDYFHGKESRGSNSWIDECDLLIVAGTPRVPSDAVQDRLLQSNCVAAACRPGRWNTLDYWSGRTVSGKRETVRSRGYGDRDWHAAAREMVHAELHQAIGRARPLSENGIPLTIVLSSEELGLPLADEKLPTANRRKMENALTLFTKILSLKTPPLNMSETPNGVGGELSANFAKYYNLKQTLPIIVQGESEFVSEVFKCSEWRTLLGMKSERSTRQMLMELEDIGLLTRKGERGGWYASFTNLELFVQVGEPFFKEKTPRPSSTTNATLRSDTLLRRGLSVAVCTQPLPKPAIAVK